jgi:hypothetical protein
MSIRRYSTDNGEQDLYFAVFFLATALQFAAGITTILSQNVAFRKLL